MAPFYDYRAYAPDGMTKKGIVEADGIKTARQKLKKQGLLVTYITEKDSKAPGQNPGNVPFMGGKVKARDIALITRQLASLVKANIPLVEALSGLVEQAEKENLKVTLEKVRQDVNEGSSLAKALALHPKVFDRIFVNMVEAGESSGTLSLILLRLADLKEAQMRLRGKVISGMTYPVLMMCVAVVILVIIFTFVIPKLTKVFESTKKAIPLTTKILILISGELTTHWYLYLGAFMVGVFMFRRFISTTAGRRKWDAFKLRTPLFGALIRMIAVTRFASTMGTLLASGVPILTSMSIARNLVGNVHIEKAIDEARENITEGQPIAGPLKKSGQFPPLVIHMIAIGEKTGELSAMLKNIAETYEEQANARIESMTALMEPMMIVLMGGVVGFIVMSIFIPLMEISNIK